MPSPFPSSSSGNAGSILLIEEYGALAVAIGSALKKFAPAHRTHVVASLADAEKRATETHPELLVFDFDPPQRGAVRFFERMKVALPETRVLVIAADVSRTVLAARREPAAFEFLEKPFELSELGSAVEALLDRDAAWEGTLRDLGLLDILPMLCAAGVTTTLDIASAEHRTGEIHLVLGQIVHAEAEDQLGVPALASMLRWRTPALTEGERASGRVRTIQQPWAAVLLEAIAPANQARAVASGPPVPEPSPAPDISPRKKLVIVDDTELLLTFVEEVLRTAEPTWEIVTAGGGLEGVARVTHEQPDAVLLDYSLPDITGDEVCRRLGENDETAHIPIFMMSGHVPELAATAARFPNVVATIAKPFLSHDLVDLVRKSLANPPPSRPPLSATTPAEEVILPESAHDSPQDLSSAVERAAQPPAEEAPLKPATDGHRPPASDTSAPAARSTEAPLESSEPEPVPAAGPGVDRPAAVSIAETVPESVDDPVAQVREPDLPAPLPGERTAPVEPLAHVIASEPFRPAAVQSRQSAAPPPAQPHSELRARDDSLTRTQPDSGVAHARFATAATNAVVLGLPLEVLSIQFSSLLRMGAIRARPWSRTVSLHVHPDALPGMSLPEAGFELGRIDLDTRGNMSTVRLLPTHVALMKPPLGDAVPVGDIVVLPSNGDTAVQLMPAAVAPMTMQLFASFELAGVELSANFGIGSLVLKSRDKDIRVTLQPGGPATGVTFKSAQVLLDRSARIAEILLDAVA